MQLGNQYIIQIRTLLTKLGIDEETKETMVLEATGGRTYSIRQMRTIEAIQIIRSLQGKADDYQVDEAKQRMKRQILALCHEMGWEHDNGKVDMDRVNRWCQNRGYIKKPFDEFTKAELPKLVAQFKAMHKIYLQNA
ncbi:hypothetical protein [Flavilitoribacter nigricans]|uniref:DUF1018 domain-containing protein n=1 Tax=Flavilitoribacter nigricans (strain ATCC 23147 / DSM 23189 / NBRC 102662 / NCIMB 1420 / SS-2) TaxID=1122177 RepID=A0A2D0MWT1_FLAN2|nr:hypothetical protein [Flavilitoribacter nigricans]PHN00657.1 hypothetical protein CRP01_41080 [Flavilitoribacter nigricans DSM 23189 = NBRC 102662]